jgi:predicted transcriptional regulator
MKLTITHLINNTFQVVDMNDNDTVVFQGSMDECEKYMSKSSINEIDAKMQELDALNARIDKLGEEIKWLRESTEDLEERISALLAQK